MDTDALQTPTMASTTARSRADDARVIELARLDDPATARELVASLERRGAACARLPPRGAARVRRLHASAREFFESTSPDAKRACGVEGVLASTVIALNLPIPPYTSLYLPISP